MNFSTGYGFGLYRAANDTWDLYFNGSKYYDFNSSITGTMRSSEAGFADSYPNDLMGHWWDLAWYDGAGAHPSWWISASASYLFASGGYGTESHWEAPQYRAATASISPPC